MEIGTTRKAIMHSNATTTKIRRSMVHWNLPWIGGTKQHATGGVSKVNCIKRLLVIHSSDPELRLLDPMPGREARVLDNETLTTHNNRTHCSRGENCHSRLPKQRESETIPRRFSSRRDSELQLYRYTDGCIGCNAACEWRVANPVSGMPRPD